MMGENYLGKTFVEALRETCDTAIERSIEDELRRYFEGQLLPQLILEVKQRVVTQALALADRPGFEIRVHLEPK